MIDLPCAGLSPKLGSVLAIGRVGTAPALATGKGVEGSAPGTFGTTTAGDVAGLPVATGFTAGAAVGTAIFGAVSAPVFVGATVGIVKAAGAGPVAGAGFAAAATAAGFALATVAFALATAVFTVPAAGAAAPFAAGFTFGATGIVGRFVCVSTKSPAVALACACGISGSG